MRVSPAPGTISYSGSRVGCDFIEPYAGGTPATTASLTGKRKRREDFHLPALIL
jgi:hypothetical protein